MPSERAWLVVWLLFLFITLATAFSLSGCSGGVKQVEEVPEVETATPDTVATAPADSL